MRTSLHVNVIIAWMQCSVTAVGKSAALFLCKAQDAFTTSHLLSSSTCLLLPNRHSLSRHHALLASLTMLLPLLIALLTVPMPLCR